MNFMKTKYNLIKETGVTWLSFLTVTGTLICCALPMLLVFLGLGATVAAMISAFPIIIILTQYKAELFIGSAVLLLISIWVYRAKTTICPVDPVLAEKCNRIRVWNRNVLMLSSVIWIIGFITSYFALPFRIWLGV